MPSEDDRFHRMISVAKQLKSRTTSPLRSLNYPRVTGQMNWNATFLFFFISPHFLLRCLTWQCYLLSERIPTPLIYCLIPRADAWLAEGEHSTRGCFVLRHAQFPSPREGWQAGDNALVTPPFFFHLQHLQWKTQQMCFHSACRRRQWSSILQAERRETAAALQKHACRCRPCVQSGRPWARTTTWEENILLTCWSYSIYIVTCSGSGARFDAAAGENIRFILHYFGIFRCTETSPRSVH